jgi:uncharacterized protein (DUF924 family)
MSAAPAEGWVDDVLHVWFVELTPQDWFRKSDAVDTVIRRRFADVHAALATSVPPIVDTDPRAALAALIVLDQFSRNMFRGTAKAFASDGEALALAERAIARDFDRAVPLAQRLFFYLPFEHAEEAAAQARAVALIGTLGDTELLEYAIRHKAVIDRFGRFPHRNASLGRPSTSEEVAYLAEPGSGF